MPKIACDVKGIENRVSWLKNCPRFFQCGRPLGGPKSAQGLVG